MVLVDSDLQLVKSAHTVGNINSLGGDMTETVVSESIESLWDEIKSSELSSSVVGEYEVRCIYVRNISPNNETMKQCQVWIEQNTASPFTDIDIGIGTAQMGDPEQTVANEDTLPDNIGWTFARGEENAEFLGDIATGQGKSIWIRRHAGPTRSDSSYPSDNYILRFKFLRTGALEPGPPPPGGSGGDPFGIRMIYPTQTSGDVSAPFYMNMNDPYSDCRFNTNTGMVATKNGDGSWALGPSPRIRLYTSLPGCARDIYDVLLDTYDHDIWGERGYMKAPNDWKNVEITGYFKVVSIDPANTSERKLYLYSRTFRHNTGVGGGCSGTAYKGVIYGSDGVLKWHKEQFHNGAQPCGDRSIIEAAAGIPHTDNNSWFGMKVMMWNYPNPANPNVEFVHLELWLDLSNSNTWVKMAERNDIGSWYAGMPNEDICFGDEYCGGHFDQVIKWGGPTTEIRWDAGYTNVHFKNLSCREIIPGSSTSPPPPPGPGPGPSPPPPGPGTDAFGITQIYASKPGGSSWASTLWNNGVTRNVTAPSVCTAESQDSRLRLSEGSNRIDIDGAGTMKVSTSPTSAISAPRVPISGTWQNVEQSVYLRVVTGSTAYIQLRCKAEHECEATNDQFGGYILYVDFINQSLYFKKEKSHNIGYSARLFEKPVTLSANTYYGFKTICYNVGTGVRLEAYMDITQGANGGTWVKQIEGSDTGAWIGSPDTQVCSQSTIRTDLEAANSSVEYKWWSIREIDPSIPPSPPPPPGPPPGPSPPPPPPPPAAGSLDTFGILMLNETKSGAKTWFSTAWASNGSRLLGAGNTDPFDSKVLYDNGQPDTTQLEITGTAPGEAFVDELNSSTRIFVQDTWLNTEQTIYFFRDVTDGTMTDIHLRSRSRHQTACSFGNYLAIWRDHTNTDQPDTGTKYSAIEVEAMHPNYIRHLDEKTTYAGLPRGQWIGLKQVTRTITSSGHVKVESYINYDITKQTTADWIKTNEYTFTGSNIAVPPAWVTDPTITDCENQGDGTANKLLGQDPQAFLYTGTGNLAWMRCNNTTKVRFKFFSVREVNPF